MKKMFVVLSVILVLAFASAALADKAETVTVVMGFNANVIPFGVPQIFQDADGWYRYQQLIPASVIMDQLGPQHKDRVYEIQQLGFVPMYTGQLSLDAVEMMVTQTYMTTPSTDMAANLGSGATTVFLGPVNAAVTAGTPYMFDLKKNGQVPTVDLQQNILLQIRTKNAAGLQGFQFGANDPGFWRVYRPLFGGSSPVIEPDGLSVALVLKPKNANSDK